MTVFVLAAPHGAAAWPDVIGILPGPTHFADLTRDDSIERMARRILAEAPARFALAGHCLGGFVALEILRLAPDRIERLALLNTNCRADSPDEAARRALRIAALDAQAETAATPDDDYVARAARWLVAPANLRNGAVRARVEAALRGVPLDIVCRQQRAIAARLNQRAALAAAPRPTLILAGALDRMTPPERSGEMHAQAPWAHLTVIENCAHMSVIEQPIAAGQALARWAATPG